MWGLDEKEFEASTIFGGSSSSSSSSKSSGGKGGSTTNYDNIVLSNVPYYNQTDGISNNWRSRYYCGLASCFMVRHKGYDSSSSSYLYNCSQSEIDKYMKYVDDAMNDYYCSSWYFDSLNDYEYVNIAGSATEYNAAYDGGLLYNDKFLDNSLWCNDTARVKLFNKTASLINELYTSSLVRLPYSVPVGTNVNNVNVAVLGASEAQDKIWNHIKNKKEPVVVVIDSQQTDNLYNKYNVDGMSNDWRNLPILHYNIIVGIKEDSTGKYFIVNDPWVHSKYGSGKHRTYKAEDYIKAMSVNSYVTPQWIYYYGINYHTGNWYDDSCYVMFVNE